MKNYCKHIIKYRQYFFDTPTGYKEFLYDELTYEQKKEADEKQIIHSSWMRCSEHCGNTVRDK